MFMRESKFLATHRDFRGYISTDCAMPIGTPTCLELCPDTGATVLSTVTFIDCDDIDREFYLDTIGG